MRIQLPAVLVLAGLMTFVGCGGGEDPNGGPDAGNADASTETCLPFPDRFDQDTTVAKGCYLAEKIPVIGAAVRLTLEPGVRVVFAEDVGLSFGGEQVLVAAGTAAEPIVLTGALPQRGYWRGVRFDGNQSPDTRLDHVTVEYAGRTSGDHNAAAIKLVADSRGVHARITNTTMRESQGWGLWLTGSAVVAEFASNTLTKNTLGPASVDSAVVAVLDEASSYSGNDRNELHVRANRLGKDATWKALDVPYFVETTLTIDAALTLSPGTTLVMAEDTRIAVGGDDAALNALGTSDEPILFTCEDKVRGCWTGIILDGSLNTRNQFAWTTVEYAGRTTADRDSAGIKAIADSHGVRLTLSHVTIKESQGWGLYLALSAQVPTFESNTLTLNTLGAAKVGSMAAHQLLGNSTFTGNDVDQVAVMAVRVHDVTWRDLGVPYVFDSNLAVLGVWTLEPGVELAMPANAKLAVGGEGPAIHAVGTAEKPIVFTGIQKVAGAWGGIVLDNTKDVASVFDHVVLEYAGGAQAAGLHGQLVAMSDSRGVSFSMTNSTVQHGAEYGIWLGGAANVNADLESSNTFFENPSGAIFREQ